MANAIQSKRLGFLILLSLFSYCQAQNKISKRDLIKLVHADKIERVPGKYDGNLLFSGKVIFRHKGAELRADSAIFYQESNFFKAFSNVEMKNPKYNLKSQYIEYSGDSELAVAEKNVVLKDPTQTLYTDRIEYDRKINKAYYNRGGTIRSKENTITSKIGTYDLETKTNTFTGNVIVSNEDYFIEGDNINMNNEQNYVEFFGPTTIQSKKNSTQFIKTTKGKYYLKKKEAFLKERSSVYSDGKYIVADELYYNQITGIGKGEGDVLIDDPKEKRYIKGEIGEFYKQLDSAFVTKNALAVKAFEKDSLYLHADTLMATKKDSLSLIRAFNKAKFFKSNLQGKSDSIVFSEENGTIKMYKKPVVFSDYKQVTGNLISIFINMKYEQLDSMHVKENAFAVAQRDTLHPKQFNQLKSKDMTAIFKNDSLEWVQASGNAQSTLYLEQENKKTKEKDLLGINRSDCGIIEASFYEREIDIISCRIGQQSHLYPPFEFPEEEQYLPDFEWRGDEKFNRWQDIMVPEKTPALPPDNSLQETSPKGMKKEEQPQSTKQNAKK